MSGRLDVPNDRQDIGRQLRDLRSAGRAHATHGAGWVQSLPTAAARAALAITYSKRPKALFRPLEHQEYRDEPPHNCTAGITVTM